MGYEFLARDADDNYTIKITERGESREKRFKLLDVCEFTSSRKRMSCIFQIDEKMILMCKGADSVIEKLLT